MEQATTSEPLCASCNAACCRLPVMLVTDTGVPPWLIATDRWGGQTMDRLDDGWCVAVDRQTMRCTIYDKRPQICSRSMTNRIPNA